MLDEIPGKYFAADLEASDLLGVVKNHPTLFWSALVLVSAACLIYCIYRFAKKKEAG